MRNSFSALRNRHLDVLVNRNRSVDREPSFRYHKSMKGKAVFVFLAGWMIPGCGHLLEKKYIRAALFFTSITVLFTVGLLLQGRFYEVNEGNPLAFLAFVGNLGNGLLYLAAKLFGWTRTDFASITYEYGTAYMITSGLLNFLIALNGYDICRGRKK